MTAEAETECADNNAKDLIQRRQPSRCGRMNPANPNGGLLLQSIALRQSDGGECDDEKRHQPIVGKTFAEHVDNSGLPCRAKERETGRKSGHQRGRNNNESRTKSKGETNDDNRNPTQLKKFR